jgi:hypothetical protein
MITPLPSENPKRDGLPPQPPSMPVLQEIACPTCGSPISQRNPSSQTLVCPKCSSYVAIGGEETTVMGRSTKLPAPPVAISLGQRVALDGVTYFVLGRVLYEGWDADDDEPDRWRWTEWQAGSPDGRMVWFAYSAEEGFTVFRKLRIREPFNPLIDREIPVGNGDKFIVHERYPARIIGAEGELSWRATADERLTMVEGAAKGKRYSLQHTAEELEVYEGAEMEEAAVAAAVGDEAWAKRITARKHGKQLRATIGLVCLAFAAVAIVLAVLAAGNQGRLAFNQQVVLTTTAPLVKIPFDIDVTGRPIKVQVWMLTAITANTAYDVDVSIISPNEQEAALFELDFWHEAGVDGGEAWVEKNSYGEDLFVPFLTGPHVLELEFGTPPAAGAVPEIMLQVAAYKERLHHFWLLMYGIVVGIVGAVLWVSGSTNIGWGPIIVVLVVVGVIVALLASGVDIIGGVLDFLSEIEFD